MQEEGVIKFDLHFSAAAAVSLEPCRELNAWRSRLWQLGLIGQDPERYLGYGFGNVSQRLPATRGDGNMTPFLISGTQTGGLPELSEAHYAVVTACDVMHNRVDACGPVQPSSESLTHGMVYAQSNNIRVVLHVHSPDIWQAADALGLPVTDAAVEYGTPAMALEVDRLFGETDVTEQKIFSMGGHEDGVIAFGDTAAAAGTVLTDTLFRCSNSD